MGNVVSSLMEFERCYFPGKLLDRLDETTCKIFNLNKIYQHRLHKSEGNPLVGYLEVAKPNWGILFDSFVQFKKTVCRHYELEGFSVSGIFPIRVKRGSEEYDIYLQNKGHSLMAIVSEKK